MFMISSFSYLLSPNFVSLGQPSPPLVRLQMLVPILPEDFNALFQQTLHGGLYIPQAMAAVSRLSDQIPRGDAIVDPSQMLL